LDLGRKVWQEIKEASIGTNNFNPSKWISRAQEEGRGNCLLSSFDQNTNSYNRWLFCP